MSLILCRESINSTFYLTIKKLINTLERFHHVCLDKVQDAAHIVNRPLFQLLSQTQNKSIEEVKFSDERRVKKKYCKLEDA